MKLPIALLNSKEWTLVGPMGPEVPEALLAHSILCVDGGAHFSSHMDIWVGDSDSYENEIKCEAAFRFRPEKDHSDFALALSLFKENSPHKIHCWGFLGGRRDHEIFNLGESMAFLENRPGTEFIFYDHNGKINFKLFGKGQWQLAHQGLFSLGSIKNVSLELFGKVKYPLRPACEMLPLSSLGLSNEAQGDFTLITEGPVMMIFPELV